MKPEQSYSDRAADLCGIARNCKFICKKNCCGEAYVDGQIGDVIIKEIPHADIRRLSSVEKDPSLNHVIKKANALITLAETHKVLKGELTEVTNHQMSASYKDKHKPIKHYASSHNADSGKIAKLKSCPQCFIQHDRKQCSHRNKLCSMCQRIGHISSVYQSKPTNASSASTVMDEATSTICQVIEKKITYMNAKINKCG